MQSMTLISYNLVKNPFGYAYLRTFIYKGDYVCIFKKLN